MDIRDRARERERRRNPTQKHSRCLKNAGGCSGILPTPYERGRYTYLTLFLLPSSAVPTELLLLLPPTVASFEQLNVCNHSGRASPPSFLLQVGDGRSDLLSRSKHNIIFNAGERTAGGLSLSSFLRGVLGYLGSFDGYDDKGEI